ncbi:hypothetical protein ACEWY4_010450 [Coilia grayii]|uniref:RING-type domain-containing protein n=1 Tax=Coilia grayii TaxID=363190 RepID=A0ABD1K2L1_9TELE
MSEEGGYCGRKRKRKCSSRPSRPALPSSLSGQSSPLPGRSREDVVPSDDEDTTSSKRSRPGAVSSLPRDENSRSPPQPGTSYHASDFMEVPRAGSDNGYLSDTTPRGSTHQDELLLAALAALPPDIVDLVALLFALLAILLLSDDNNYDFDLLEAALNDTSDLPETETGFIYNLASNYADGLPTVLFDPLFMTEDRDCRICLEDYERGEEITVLPCLHGFHSSCVLHWLQGNPTCPLCRARLE